MRCAENPGISKGGAAQHTPLLSHMYISVVSWWPFGNHTPPGYVTQLVETPGACPGRDPETLPALLGVTGRLSHAIRSRKYREYLKLLVLALVCAGWDLQENGCGCGERGESQAPGVSFVFAKGWKAGGRCREGRMPIGWPEALP